MVAQGFRDGDDGNAQVAGDILHPNRFHESSLECRRAWPRKRANNTPYIAIRKRYRYIERKYPCAILYMAQRFLLFLRRGSHLAVEILQDVEGLFALAAIGD